MLQNIDSGCLDQITTEWELGSIESQKMWLYCPENTKIKQSRKLKAPSTAVAHDLICLYPLQHTYAHTITCPWKIQFYTSISICCRTKSDISAFPWNTVISFPWNTAISFNPNAPACSWKGSLQISFPSGFQFTIRPHNPSSRFRVIWKEVVI